MAKKTKHRELTYAEMLAAESRNKSAKKKDNGIIFGNRKVKDTLFRRVFRDKQHLLELYNALNDSNYTNDDELEVVTIEDVIFLKVKNDLSFIVGNTLNLYGHQSTFSPNLALRAFIYFGKHYESIAAQSEISPYGSKLIPLPFPMCVVFYNGDMDIDDEGTIKMSTAFEVPDGKEQKNILPAVDCTVKILNINYGHNKELFEKCNRIYEYARFIQIVKDFLKTEPNLDRALEAAVNRGIREKLLPDILIPEKVGVMNMLLTEFDQEKYERTIFSEGYDQGHAKGYEDAKSEDADIINKLKDENERLRKLIGSGV